MAKGKSSVTEAKVDDHGYWMYSDGVSRWGIGLMRNGEAPLKTTEMMHKTSFIDTKIEWHKEEYARLEDAKKAALEKK